MAARPQGMRELKVRRPRPVTPRTPYQAQNPKHAQVEDALLYLDQVKASVLYLRSSGVCGDFTPSRRVVSRREGGGWFLFRF